VIDLNNLGLAGKIGRSLINSKLVPLLMIAFLITGLYSVSITPREEEPQIDVPIADIFVRYPGASPKEVENRVTAPLERLISNIHGVEYVYSVTMPENAMLIVRFYVGEDVEKSLVKLYNELNKHMDTMPPGVSMPLVKTKSIDDVPIVALTLWSNEYDDYGIRRVAAELANDIKKIDNVSHTKLVGGRKREFRVLLKRDKMVGYNIDPLSIVQQLGMSSQQSMSGMMNTKDEEYLVETGDFFGSSEEIQSLVVGVFQGSPIYLKNVADIVDGPEVAKNYVSFGYGAGSNIQSDKDGNMNGSAVTISVSKRKGTDAMKIANQIMEKTEKLKGTLVPSSIKIETTRNYGATAAEKVNTLFENLIGSILAVTIVLAIFMGWRGGLVIFVSVPITFALTLFTYYMLDYTLNRITLFALIFVTGIVVDVSIIVAENMHRHFKMQKMPFLEAAIYSIDEVGNPTILATFTVIASVLPMAFVSGMMGPYMSPMAIGASFSIVFSLVVAFLITPWVAFRFLKGNNKFNHEEKGYDIHKTLIYKFYKKMLTPLMKSRFLRWSVIFGITGLMVASMSLIYYKKVAVKMLPFDNKNEFQIIIDMPEGTTLERTEAVTKEIAARVAEEPEVVNYQTYVGTSAPINFNGLVRHYDLRRGSNVADIQVNILDKEDRNLQSHDIAKRIRPIVQKIGKKYNANVKVGEVPPGPPVMSTLVAEIYGSDEKKQMKAAKRIKKLFETTDGVVDVDWWIESDQKEYKIEIDKEKAMLLGIVSKQIVNTVGIALHGMNAAHMYLPEEKEQVNINLRLPSSERSSIEDLKSIHIKAMTGKMVALSDLVIIKEQIQDKNIYRKNQQRVIYVTADMAGSLESPIYAIFDVDDKIANLKKKGEMVMNQLYTSQPFMDDEVSMKWDGEWHITYEVFRDLGIAFGVALLVIYILIIAWFQSFRIPLIMMVAIPLSLVGVLGGHWMYDAFFTATSMIGTIALSGIMVRNSVLLIDFINLRLKEGASFEEAVIEAGAVRTMPIFLTAGTVAIGSFVIIFDPIFQGMAISLMGGSIASTILTLLIVPIIYYMSEKKAWEKKLKEEEEKSEKKPIPAPHTL